MTQILTNAEEDTLVRWIKRYTNTGTHITNPLLKELAIYIRLARVTYASRLLPSITPRFTINDKWIQRFPSWKWRVENLSASTTDAPANNMLQGATIPPTE